MSDSLCDQLDAFVTDCLSAPARDEFHEHLTICNDCRQAVRDHERIDRLLAAAASELGSVPAGLIVRIEQEVRVQARRRAVQRLAILAAAAVALLSCGLWLAASRSGQPLVNRPTSSGEQRNIATMPLEPASPTYEGDPKSNRPSFVQVTVDDLEAIALPIESQDSNVSIFWIYPTEAAKQTQKAADPEPSGFSFPRSEI